MKREVNFAKYSSIKIGPTIDVELIDTIDDYSDYYIVGGASNILLSDTPQKLAMLSREYNYIKEQDGHLVVGCATPSGKLYSYCKRNNIANFELLGKLPGQMGGLIKMNAGLKEYEIFEYLVSIKTKDGIISKDDIEYGYRYTNIDTIIYEATFEIHRGFDTTKVEMFTNMRKNQPPQASAGSCFKNPEGEFAGRLIQEVGLKGERIGDASFSDVHANFLINYGNATYSDAKKLIDIAKDEVKSKYGITLEEEIIIL
jgi:UDP-N-acetylmuramate dehydrogenase